MSSESDVAVKFASGAMKKISTRRYCDFLQIFWNTLPVNDIMPGALTYIYTYQPMCMCHGTKTTGTKPES